MIVKASATMAPQQTTTSLSSAKKSSAMRRQIIFDTPPDLLSDFKEYAWCYSWTHPAISDVILPTVGLQYNAKSQQISFDMQTYPAEVRLNSSFVASAEDCINDSAKLARTDAGIRLASATPDNQVEKSAKLRLTMYPNCLDSVNKPLFSKSITVLDKMLVTSVLQLPNAGLAFFNTQQNETKPFCVSGNYSDPKQFTIDPAHSGAVLLGIYDHGFGPVIDYVNGRDVPTSAPDVATTVIQTVTRTPTLLPAPTIYLGNTAPMNTLLSLGAAAGDVLAATSLLTLSAATLALIARKVMRARAQAVNENQASPA